MCSRCNTGCSRQNSCGCNNTNTTSCSGTTLTNTTNCGCPSTRNSSNCSFWPIFATCSTAQAVANVRCNCGCNS